MSSSQMQARMRSTDAGAKWTARIIALQAYHKNHGTVNDQIGKVFLTRVNRCICFHVIQTTSPEAGKESSRGCRGTCANCSAQTSDYCLGCHRWLCNNTRSDKPSGLDGWRSHVIISNPLRPNDEPIHCHETCMFQVHRSQQIAALGFLERQLVAGSLGGSVIIEADDGNSNSRLLAS